MDAHSGDHRAGDGTRGRQRPRAFRFAARGVGRFDERPSAVAELPRAASDRGLDVARSGSGMGRPGDADTDAAAVSRRATARSHHTDTLWNTGVARDHQVPAERLTGADGQLGARSVRPGTPLARAHARAVRLFGDIRSDARLHSSPPPAAARLRRSAASGTDDHGRSRTPAWWGSRADATE